MSSRNYHEPVEDPPGEFMVRLFAEKSIARCERVQVSVWAKRYPDSL
jgi:hypothetical protein